MADTNPPLESAEPLLILAPFGQDGKLASSVLEKAGLQSLVCSSMTELCQQLRGSVAAALIAEEALAGNHAEQLRAALAIQEPWSDLPIIVLTSSRARTANVEKILIRFSELGNFSLLERPFHVMTLVASVRTALRARKRQYQVRELLQEQTGALRLRDEFLSIASHELKTPLTSLKMQVQMRKRFAHQGDVSIYSPSKVNALLELTEHQVNRLSRLVDDMQDVSRIASGKLTLHRERCELGEIVSEVLESLSSQFQTAQCEVTLDIVKPAWGLWDRYRIEQVVTNLFTNAIKYGPSCPVLVRVSPEGRWARLVVQDQGRGIAEEDQARVFQRFERAVSGGNISGLGLGLYISRQILEMQGGHIRLDSELGQGSTFTVDLPLEGA